MFAYGMT